MLDILHTVEKHPVIEMMLRGVGELTSHNTHWNLVYADCGHVQAFALEGLDDPKGAEFFVQRYYAQCLTCALVNRPVAAKKSSVEPDQFTLRDTLDELASIITALRSGHRRGLADRLDNVLRQLGQAN